MSADQVAEIAPLIREVFQDARGRSKDEKFLCATFEVVGVNGAWAQITPEELNVAYPLSRSPDEELREVIRSLPAAQLVSWEPNKFATWSFVSVRPAEVAKIVDLVLAKLFHLGDYAVDGTLERL